MSQTSTQQYAKDVQCSLEAVEKEMAEKKNGIKAKILDVFGSGELADAKRAIAERDAQIDALKVKCEEKDSLLSRYEHGELTEEELVNEVFLPEEQINECQMSLLVAMLNVASGGPATPHVGTGGGGGSSDLPWNDKKKRGHFR